MIPDDDVKQLFWDTLNIHRDHLSSEEALPTQFYRGRGPQTWENWHPGGCNRHKSVFDRFNAIPKYCFDCYKVSIEPRTVVELFKLMMVFEKLELPNDNSRKCLAETREQISGAYKGLIVCIGLEEGIEILKLMERVIAEKISNKIKVTLRRGCSEYGIAYPEYARVEQGMTTMDYKESWQEYEDLVDKELVITEPPAGFTYNRPTYTPQDVRVMFYWIKYAATIGDLSYLKIWGNILEPFPDLKRPSPYSPVEND